MPLLSTPHSIQVFTSDLINDLGVWTTEDLLNYASGVKTGGHFYGFDMVRIRGFAAYESFVDGLPDNGAFDLYQELYGVEKVEVIKGPTSFLYGKSPMGGVVHYSSKKPRAKNFADVHLVADSNVSLEQGADIGLTTESKNLYFRLVALNRNEKLFIKFAGENRQYLAPSLTWDINKKISLTFLSLYRRHKRIYAMPLPASGTVKDMQHLDGRKISKNIFVGSKSQNDMRLQNFQLGYQFKYEILDWLRLRQNFRYSKLMLEWNDFFWPAKLKKNKKTLILIPDDTESEVDQYLVDTATDFHFEFLGWIYHDFTFGVDLNFGRLEKISLKPDTNYQDENLDTSFLPKVDLYNSRTENFNAKYVFKDEYGPDFTQGIATYLQNTLNLLGVTFNLGLRYDYFTDKLFENGKRQTLSTGAFSFNTGVNYELIKGLFSAYLNYSEPFKNQAQLKNAKGESLKPEKGRSVEGGLKLQAFRKKLVSTLAVYRLMKTNVAFKKGENYYSLAGEQTSSGFEFDVLMNITPEVSSTLNYTFTSTEIVKSARYKKGNLLPGVPKHGISIWGNYTFQSSFLKNLALGMGVRYFTEQQGDMANSFALDDYAILDALVTYRFHRSKVLINFNNITNYRYYQGSFNDLHVLSGKPFNVKGSFTMHL